MDFDCLWVGYFVCVIFVLGYRNVVTVVLVILGCGFDSFGVGGDFVVFGVHCGKVRF